MKLIDAIKNGYKKRLEYMIEHELLEEPELAATGSGGVMHFFFGKSETKERAEKVIQRTAKWFDQCPYISESGVRRSSQGECDFAANRLIRVLYEGADRISEDTADLRILKKIWFLTG